MLHPQCSIGHQMNLIPSASLSNAPSICLARKPSIGHDSSKKHVVVKGQTRHKNMQVVKRYATSNGGNNGVQRKPLMVAMDESSSSNSSCKSSTQVGAESLSTTFGQSADTIFNIRKMTEEWQSMKDPV